jgi:hypothetical protein
MFYVTAIDGKGISNSYDASQAASRRHGFALTTKFVTRRIEAKSQRVKLIGTYVSAAPIVTLFDMAAGKTSIVGEVEFTLEPGGSYIVKGELGDKGAVWIEDANTHAIVTEKVVTRWPEWVPEKGFVDQRNPGSGKCRRPGTLRAASDESQREERREGSHLHS